MPSVASWRLASLAKALDAASVARLLASCDRRTRVGRRDYAILTVLSRLGLRAGEVAALQLGDVDWRAGEVLIRGKGSRHERLPLPADVGEALAGWLARGHPRCESAFVFTRLRAPHGGLSASAVSQIVRRACQRAGLPVVGAHRLRHTAATEMLRAGGSLTEVGQVLRHRGRDVTSIYAKVDRLALAAGRCAVARSRGMSALAEHAQDYLQVRRALGFKLVGEGRLLAEFVAFAEAAGQRDDHHRDRAGLGAAAAQRQPQLSVAAAASGPRVRALPARRSTPPARSRRSSCCPPASTAPPRTSTPTRRSSR